MTDTISAIATAYGAAALGIIRISGPKAKDVVQQIVPKAQAHRYPHRMRFGYALDKDTGEVIDEVLCFWAPGPQSATGEDIAEIHAHGGVLVLNQLLSQTFHAGARPALPGEFTRRAYTNGKQDLTQAEAVMSLIGAKSELAARTAARQLGGAIGEGLAEEYQHITNIAAMLEACLDFPDEDLPVEQIKTFVEQLTQIEHTLQTAVRSYHMGQLLTQGAQVVIAGPSNAGKSSLLNALIHEDKALVDSAPGTTRDVVEAQFEIEGIPITFMDTAGLRFGAQKVEQMGMEKSKKALRNADLILLVVDASAPLDTELNIQHILDSHPDNTLLVLNKNDIATFSPTLQLFSPSKTVQISALNRINLDELYNKMAQFLLEGTSSTADIILTTARQASSVETALNHTCSAKQILASNSEPELAAADIRWAREALADLWGKHAQTDVIDTIFLSFCLGK